MDYFLHSVLDPQGFWPAGEQVVSFIKRQNNELKAGRSHPPTPALAKLRPAGIIKNMEQLFALFTYANRRRNGLALKMLPYLST